MYKNLKIQICTKIRIRVYLLVKKIVNVADYLLVKKIVAEEEHVVQNVGLQSVSKIGLQEF